MIYKLLALMIKKGAEMGEENNEKIVEENKDKEKDNKDVQAGGDKGISPE